MKTCSQCKETKSLNSYYKNTKHGYFPYCKQCAKNKYARKHYDANKKKYIASAYKSNANFRNKFLEYKATLKCTKCNEDRPWCLDLHHVDPSTKANEISYFVNRYNTQLLQEEIKKCIPLCRNCHADFHYHKRRSKPS